LIQKFALGTALVVSVLAFAFYLKEHPSLQKRIYSPEEIHVRISGPVKNPGIYTMESGATEKDLIERAGGLLPHVHVSLEESSLEQLLVDGQAIDLGKR